MPIPITLARCADLYHSGGMLFAGRLAGAGSLSDAPGSSALVAAVAWLEGTLLGTLATTVAIIAVSWVGLLMLMGRLDTRRGLTVIAGCFVLFGASSIIAGIKLSMGGPGLAAADMPPAPLPALKPDTRPVNPDPYAGAAVPAQ